MGDLKKDKEEVAATMRRLYNQGLTTASGGNVSKRSEAGILVTPSQSDKAVLSGDQVSMTDMEGNQVDGEWKISMETAMHLAIYKKRPDIKAVVHAHPVVATSFAIAHKVIKTNLAGESRFLLGDVILAPYALMGTNKLAENVAEAAASGNVILLENHGVITLGESLFQAYDRMEVLEACAKMTLVTGWLGGAEELNEKQIREIDNLI